MYSWFVKNAPIRKKMNVLLVIYLALSAINVGFAALVYFGGGSGLTALVAAVAVCVISLTVSVFAREGVVVPYVATVVRMEALADGDTKSPIIYQEHGDCVGRMAAAMEIFRANTVRVEAQAKQAERVVQELVPSFETLASGDLTRTLPLDSLGEGFEALPQAFNETVRSLSKTIGELRESALRVDTGSDEIRAASDDLATRNEQQAASLEETAASMSQVTQLVRKSADNAKAAQLAMSSTHKQATDGGEVVKRAVAAMASIESSAKEITQIIDVIDGIAFQTNLLALNAGVEAARAGDAGKGFAVVANEVRALAQRSAEAARDIKHLISTSTSHVGEGVNLVGETGSLLEAIVEQIGNVTSQVDDIATMASAQAENLDQVNTSVGAMDQMTQRNAAMVEETTAAARSLSDEATRLERMVARFKLASARESAALTKLEVPARARAQRAPVPAATASTVGNLALKHEEAAVVDDHDWSEF